MLIWRQSSLLTKLQLVMFVVIWLLCPILIDIMKYLFKPIAFEPHATVRTHYSKVIIMNVMNSPLASLITLKLC
jgi:hypothetical protein